MGRRTIKRSAGQKRIDGKDFLLAEEIDYIRSRAAEHDARLVTIGSLALFSTETGDAWLLVRILHDSDHPFSSEADHPFSRDSDQRSPVKPIAVLL